MEGRGRASVLPAPCNTGDQFGVRHDGGPGTDQDLCATRPLAWHREGASTVCAGGPDVSAAGARGRPLQVAGRAKPYQRSSAVTATRSEERRVGKESVRTCKSRWSQHPQNKE